MALHLCGFPDITIPVSVSSFTVLDIADTLESTNDRMLASGVSNNYLPALSNMFTGSQWHLRI